jgi:hypothetical protein
MLIVGTSEFRAKQKRFLEMTDSRKRDETMNDET